MKFDVIWRLGAKGALRRWLGKPEYQRLKANGPLHQFGVTFHINRNAIQYMQTVKSIHNVINK